MSTLHLAVNFLAAAAALVALYLGTTPVVAVALAVVAVSNGTAAGYRAWKAARRAVETALSP